MLWLLTILSVVFTLFLLFIGSFLAQLLDKIVDPSWVRFFEDVATLNPTLQPSEVVIGTLLSYFVVTALFVVLLRISHELKKRRDVYDLEGAIKEGVLLGSIALIVGGAMRLLGLQQGANLIIPLFVFLSEVRRNLKVALFVTILFVLVSWGSSLYITEYRPDPAVVTALYYLILAFVPPVLIWLARNYMM